MPHQSSCVTDEDTRKATRLGNAALEIFLKQLEGVPERATLKTAVEKIKNRDFATPTSLKHQNASLFANQFINELVPVINQQAPVLSEQEKRFLLSGVKTKYQYVPNPVGALAKLRGNGSIPLYDESQAAPEPSVPRPARTAAPVQPPRQRTATPPAAPKKPFSLVPASLKKWWQEKRKAKPEPVAKPPAQDQNRWSKAIASLASAFKKPLPKTPTVREFKRKTTEKRSSDQTSNVLNPLVAAQHNAEILALQQAATGTGLASSGQSTPELTIPETPTTPRSRAGSNSTTESTQQEFDVIAAEVAATQAHQATPVPGVQPEPGNSSPVLQPPASPAASVHSASSATGSDDQAPGSPRTPVPQPPTGPIRPVSPAPEPPRAPIPTPAGATTPASGASQQPPAPPVPPVKGRGAQTRTAHPTQGESTSEPQNATEALAEANEIGLNANNAERKRARSNAKLRFLTWRSAKTLQNHSEALANEANTLQSKIDRLVKLGETVSTSALQAHLTEKRNKLLENKKEIDAKLGSAAATTGSATTSTDPSDNDAGRLYNWARRARLTKGQAFPELKARAQALNSVLKKPETSTANPLRKRELEEEVGIIEREIKSRENARLKALQASVPTPPEPPKIPAPKETNSAQSPEDYAKQTATRKQVPTPTTQVRTSTRLPAQKPLQREDSSTTASPLSKVRPLQRPAPRPQPRPAVPTHKLEVFTPPPLPGMGSSYAPINPKGRSQKNPLQELEELKKRGPARIKR